MVLILALCGAAYAATPIYTPTDLDNVRSNLSGDYILLNDIDLSSYISSGSGTASSTLGWLPIGSTGTTSRFTGSFDGNGHVIKGLWANRTTLYVGLFGYTENAMIRNLGVEIDNGKGGVVGYQSVGGLVGCQTSNGGGSSIIENCYATGNVASIWYEAGGLVGQQSNGAYGGSGSVTIINCYATGDVKAGNYGGGGLVGAQSSSTGGSSCTIENCYATGNVTAPDFAGGLVGHQDISITDSSSAIVNCYATGNVTATTNFAGGLVGYQHSNGTGRSSKIENCYAFGDVTSPGADAFALVGAQAGTGTNSIAGVYRYENVKVNDSVVPANHAESAPDKLHGGVKTGEELMTKTTYTGNNWKFNPVGPWYWDDLNFPKLNIGKEKSPFPIIYVSGVTLPTSADLVLDSTLTLTATINPSHATNQFVKWSTSDATIATVASTGFSAETTVTVMPNSTGKTGTVTITVETEDGSKTAACLVTVKPVSVAQVNLDKTAVTIQPGSTNTVTATVLPVNATFPEVTWSKVANADYIEIVPTTGNTVVVIANIGYAGASTIRATADGVSRECVITIPTVDVTNVTLNSTSLTLNTGGTYTLAATVMPANATVRAVSFVTSDGTVATVDNTSGLVTANGVKAGVATITATSGTQSAYCSVQVNKIGGGTETLAGGTQVTLPSETVTYPDGSKEIPVGQSGAATTADGIVVGLPEGTTIDHNGNITIQTGSKATMPNGTEIEIPGGTTIWSDGSIKLPGDEGGKVTTTDGVEVELPEGSVIWPDGSVTLPPDTVATVTVETAIGVVQYDVSGGFMFGIDEITLLNDASGKVTVAVHGDGGDSRIILPGGVIINGDTILTGNGGAVILTPDGKTMIVGKDKEIKINPDGSISAPGDGGGGGSGGGCNTGFGFLAFAIPLLRRVIRH